MNRVYDAPAKLNLSLLVEPPRADGLHPLVSLVQTVDWLDRLTVDMGERSDTLKVTGNDVEVEDNLVLRAVAAVRRQASVPPLSMTLRKDIPVAAGLGGGSADAAAALLAAAEAGGHSPELAVTLAPQVGADVSLFLAGGTQMMSGIGEVLEQHQPLSGFALAIVVPEFGCSTPEVYSRWDEMEGPEGEEVPVAHLPPQLRGVMPMRNDLTPAALELEPQLGDYMADVRALWETSVCLTGSGSACFGYFAAPDEAAGAAQAARDFSSAVRAVELRPFGVRSV